MQWMRIALQYSEKTWHQVNLWMCSSSGIDEDAEKKWANQCSSNDARRQKVSLTAFDWLDAYELCWLLDDVLLIWLWLKYCKLLNASKLNLPIPNIVTVISANFYQWCNEIYHVFTNLFYFSKCFLELQLKKERGCLLSIFVFTKVPSWCEKKSTDGWARISIGHFAGLVATCSELYGRTFFKNTIEDGGSAAPVHHLHCLHC